MKKNYLRRLLADTRRGLFVAFAAAACLSAQADELFPSTAAITVGRPVTEITAPGYYVLQNKGANKYITQPAEDPSNLSYTSTSDDYHNVIYLAEGSTSGTYTIQFYNGYYAAQLGSDQSQWTAEETNSPQEYTLTATGSGTFFLENNGMRLNNNNSYPMVSLTQWSGNNAQLYFYETTVDTLNATDYVQKVKDEISPWFTQNVGSYFGLSQAAYDANLAAYTAALEECDQERFDSLKSIVEENVNYPATGWYKLKNVATGKYMTYTDANYANGDGTTAAGVTRVTNSANNLQLVIQGVGLNSYSSNIAFTTLVATTTVDGVETDLPGVITLNGETAKDNMYLSVDVETQAVSQSTLNEAYSQWQVEDATEIRIPLDVVSNGKAYGTFAAPFSVTLADGQAYTGTFTADSTTLNMVTIGDEGTTIPGATPAVIVVDSEAADTVVATINSEAGTPADGDLSGVYSGRTRQSSWLTFGQDMTETVGTHVGFFSTDEETIGANQALIVAPTGVSSVVLDFGDPTAIATATTKAATTAYDLQGRRVLAPQHGLYIVDGKKVILK